MSPASPLDASTAPLVALATGGTGGHVFPAEALARELVDRGYRVALVTDARGGAFGAGLEAVQTYRVRAGRVGGGPAAKLVGVAGIIGGTLQGWRLLRRLDAAAVVGFGGYASVPTMLAAVMSGRPTVLHEQNAVLGRANRLLARRVGFVATSFAEVAGFSRRPKQQQARTGNPVRAAAVSLRDVPYAPPAAGPVRLVVLGGSQGAKILSDVVPAAVGQLPAPLRDRLSIVQQARAEDVDRVRAAYAQLGVAAEIAPFIADAPARLSACHLAICRSGASTVTELATLGRPAILVPYPHALDNDQTENARAMERAGAAWLMPQATFTAERLAVSIARLIEEPERLAAAASAAWNQGLPDAASRLADLVATAARLPRRVGQSDDHPQRGRLPAAVSQGPSDRPVRHSLLEETLS